MKHDVFIAVVGEHVIVAFSLNCLYGILVLLPAVLYLLRGCFLDQDLVEWGRFC